MRCSELASRYHIQVSTSRGMHIDLFTFLYVLETLSISALITKSIVKVNFIFSYFGSNNVIRAENKYPRVHACGSIVHFLVTVLYPISVKH